MYFNSSRFYKHLTIAVSALIVLLVSAVIFLSVQLVDSNETIEKLEEQISEMQETIDNNEKEDSNEDNTEDSSVDTTEDSAKNDNSNEPTKNNTEPTTTPPPVPPADLKYPTLYTEKPTQVTNPPNTVYLTFDDGPTAYTDEILDILAAEGVKATFFVVGSQVVKYPETVKRIADEGHAIGLHSYTHNYKKLYTDVDSFLLEYEKCLKEIQSITDYPVTCVRFAGGTNTTYADHIAPTLVQELTNRGYAIFDWNVDSRDSATPNATSDQIVSNVLNGCSGKDTAIVLMHDTKESTLNALPEIIDGLKKMGFQFGVLSNEIQPMQFSVQ